jgi:arsenate reductase (thioredoxin)
LKKPRVLFLCTGNSARSQMAEALLKKYAGDRFGIYSAELDPAGVNPYTIRVLDEIGLDTSGLRSKSLSDFLGKAHFRYLITVCSNAEENCPIFPGISVRLHWPFEDPAAFQGTDEQKLNTFRRIRDQIDQKILQRLAKFNSSMTDCPS